jgi:anti-sigma regulatory factor (Ser/Thr protein kinase)
VLVRNGVRELAHQLGFSAKGCEELAIVVTELSSNIVKYGVRGTIELAALEDLQRGVGIVIVAQDETPPFDLAMAMRDGHDAQGKLDPMKTWHRGGIGAGIGAVARLTDQLQLEACEGGKRIRVIRFLRRPARTPA